MERDGDRAGEREERGMERNNIQETGLGRELDGEPH